MKKILFYLPAIAAVILYGTVMLIGAGSISPAMIVWIALFCISGFLLHKKHFWGALFGLLPAMHLIYMGAQETGQMINEIPAGIVVLAFYVICGYLVFRKEANIQ